MWHCCPCADGSSFVCKYYTLSSLTLGVALLFGVSKDLNSAFHAACLVNESEFIVIFKWCVRVHCTRSSRCIDTSCLFFDDSSFELGLLPLPPPPMWHCGLVLILQSLTGSGKPGPVLCSNIQTIRTYSLYLVWVHRAFQFKSGGKEVH